jgi:hypothetical protein
MSDTSAHLVDEVFPEVPTREWVCSLVWGLRYAMGYDRRLCADVLDAFIRSLRRSLRWRAKKKLGLDSVEDAMFGAVTFIQRADSALRLNVHFHCIVRTGVYVRDERGELCFHELGTLPCVEVAEVARWTHERLRIVLERHGRSLDDNDAPDVLAQEQPALASSHAMAPRSETGSCWGPPPASQLASSWNGCPRLPARAKPSPTSVGSTSTPGWRSLPAIADGVRDCADTSLDRRSLESVYNCASTGGFSTTFGALGKMGPGPSSWWLGQIRRGLWGAKGALL